MSTTKSTRLAYIDNLRFVCIALVVIQHAAVTYSGMGRWYYNEPHGELDLPSKLFFGLIQTHLQAFFMSLFFLISGYFVPAALNRKGPRGFLVDRLMRLGIPLLVFVLLLHPFIVWMANPGLNLADYYAYGFTKFDFLGWTGPLWFVEVLLVFSLACLPFARFLRSPAPTPSAQPVPLWSFWLLIALITVGAFSLRLVFPIGSAIANLQFSFFSAYLVAFVVGVIAGRQQWFDRISFASAKRWLWASFGLGLPLWFTAMIAAGVPQGRSDMNGGANLGAYFYALWESFFCVAFIIALLGIAREKFNDQKPWMRFLSDNTFGVFVFHAAVLVMLSLLLKPLALAPVPKFLLVSVLAIAGSFLVSALVRRIPFLRATFS